MKLTERHLNIEEFHKRKWVQEGKNRLRKNKIT
jgi:hypothetical protein